MARKGDTRDTPVFYLTYRRRTNDGEFKISCVTYEAFRENESDTILMLCLFWLGNFLNDRHRSSLVPRRWASGKRTKHHFLQIPLASLRHQSQTQ